MENEKDVDLEEVNGVDASENEVETSGEQETTKTYSQEELDEMLEEQRKKINKANQDAWNRRWGHEKSKMESENAKKDELIKLLSEQTKADSVDDLLKNAYEQYGVERPSTNNTRDEERLGKLDAQELLELDDEIIEEEAERLSQMKRSVREEAIFMELGKYLTDKKEQAKRKKEIEESGIEEEVYNQAEFQDFMKKFNKETSLAEIVDLYSKTKAPAEKKEKPFSGGSLKDNKKKGESKYFTKEEFDALTAKDLKDPLIYEKAMRSKHLF